MSNPHRERQRRGDYQNTQMEDALQRAYGRLDVSIDRPSTYDRAPTPRDDTRNERPNSGPARAAKLEFKDMASFERGDCRCRVTAADGTHNRLYNFTVERQNRNQDRPTRFFRDTDAADLVALIEQAVAWITEARKTT